MEQYEKVYLYRRIVRAKLFIDEHFEDHIDLENIAEQANFSRFHFIRLFKSVYGFTPGNYLIKVRIDHARLLLSKGYSVLQTGLLIGLESPTSFSGMFKKITGQSPSDFQKKALKRAILMNQNPLQFVPNCFAESSGWTKEQF